MNGRDRRWPGRAFDFCLGALLAVMALYAAVEIIRSIWFPLCLAAAGGLLLFGILVQIRRRFDRW